MPSRFTVKTLTEELVPKIGKGEFVVRVRGNLGEPILEDALTEKGADVLPIHVYDTSTSELDDGIRAWVNHAPIDVITFTSGSTVTSFVEQWGKEEALKIAESAKIASIGPMTSQTIRSYGFNVDIEADPHSVEGVLDSIIKFIK